MSTPVTYPPKLLYLPFSANNAALRNNIPVASDAPLASYSDGFPLANMLPIVAGGVPPEGQDFNGVLYDITTHTVWVNSGGRYEFNATLAAAIGGYPIGMELQDNAGVNTYVNAVAGNTTDFNSTPSSIGVSWLPTSGQFTKISVSSTGGTLNLTATQARSPMIVVTGSLASNLTVTLPTSVLARCVIQDQTTRNGYTVQVITSSGSGVYVANGVTDTVVSDGTNTTYSQNSSVTQAPNDNSHNNATTAYVDRAVTAVGGYYQDTGAVNAYVITTIPPTTSYSDGMSFRIRTIHGNTGASTLNAGAGVVSLLREDQSPLQSGDIPTTSIFAATYSATASAFLVNGLVPSQLGSAAHLNASDQLGGVAAMQIYAGNPNGYVAGNAASGAIPPSACWDSVDQAIYMCITTGNAATAVWVRPQAPATSGRPNYVNSAQSVGSGVWLTDTSGGAFTLTLGATPALGDSLEFRDAFFTWDVNNLTINPNGHTIMGIAQNLICNVKGEFFAIVYNGSDWRLE